MINYSLQTENNIKTIDYEDLSNNMIREEIESFVENIDVEDMEKITMPTSETIISEPSTTVDIKKFVEEAKEMKLILQKADIIINKLEKSKKILIKRLKRLIYEKRILTVENQNLKQTKNLKKLFNDDQVKALYSNCKRSQMV